VNAIAKRYFTQQSPEKRVLLEKLHALVAKQVPGATVEIKWGVPFYELGGKRVCALASFKEYVGINFFAPPGKLADPKKRLEGSGQANRMLKVWSAKDIDSAAIAKWLKASVAAASA
jgi:hypothetical protein